MFPFNLRVYDDLRPRLNSFSQSKSPDSPPGSGANGCTTSPALGDALPGPDWGCTALNPAQDFPCLASA